MRKKLTLSIDEDVYNELKLVPRGFSVSEFVSFMLRAMLKEVGGQFPTQEDFEAWARSKPELKKVREGVREAWGPPVWSATEKVVATKEKVRKRLKGK
jgi:predicted CopG family antitoxin